MKYVNLILNWMFGTLFILAGVGLLVESPLGGLCLIATSLLLLPPARKAAYSKTNKELPFKARAIIILVLVIVSSILVNQSQERKSAELATQKAEEQAQQIAKTRQKNIDYFRIHREEIISSVSAALAEKNYQAAMSKSNKYLPAGDSKLNSMHAQAKSALDEITKAKKETKEKAQREIRTKELLANLKSVPASDLKGNKDLYQQLVKLNPNNTLYLKKLDQYSQKLTMKQVKEQKEQERLKKEQEKRVAKFGKPPIQSAWDGSYYVVEQYLKRVANDPDSIKISGCTKVYHTGDGWLIGCDYRGRNGFGGMIRQSNWFTIVHDQVTQMQDASAYRP